MDVFSDIKPEIKVAPDTTDWLYHTVDERNCRLLCALVYISDTHCCFNCEYFVAVDYLLCHLESA